MWHFVNLQTKLFVKVAARWFSGICLVYHLHWINNSCDIFIKIFQRSFTNAIVISIKICAEYRDMLPRPRPVCQEPGLRPIGRSPGVPDRFSRGLGSMSRYSAQISICFIGYSFHFLFLFRFGWELCGTVNMPQCPLPSSIIITMSLVIKQSKLPACLAKVQLTYSYENTLTFMPQDWRNWQIKWMKSISVRSHQYKNQVNGELFCILVSNFAFFTIESRLIPAVLELGQVRLFWN